MKSKVEPESDPLHPEGYCIFCDHDDDVYRDKHFFSKYDYEHDCLCTCHVLNDEIAEKQLLDMRFDTISKFCDKCNISYPYYTWNCVRCHTSMLREFKIHNNMKELEKNFKANELFAQRFKLSYAKHY